MKSKSKSGFVIENKWVIIGLLVLVLAIVIGIVVLAYYRSGNKTKDSNAIEPFANSSLKYPFDWVIMTKDDNNIFLIDRNNIPSQKELWHISSGISNKSLEIISNPDTVIKGSLSIPQYGIKLTAANKEFIQILPVIPPQQDTSADYGFVRPTTVGAGFTIAMWVKFPATRTFNKAGQSECLVEIFKNQKDGKVGAWKSTGSNWGGYFHIVRRANDNGTNNNQIVTGFVGISVVGPKIDDTKWHHIAVSVKLASRFDNNSGKYEIALYVDGNKTSQEFTVTDKDQIFMGAEAEFNIGKFTRGISNGELYGYANMSFTGLQLHNRVLDYYEVKLIAEKYTTPTTTKPSTTQSTTTTTTTKPSTTQSTTTTTRPTTTTTIPTTTTTVPTTTTTTVPTTTTTTRPTTTTTTRPTTTTTERTTTTTTTTTTEPTTTTTTTTEPTTTTTTIPATTTTTTIPTSTRATNVYGTDPNAGGYEEVPA